VILSLDHDAIYDLLSGKALIVRAYFEAALEGGHELRVCATTVHDLMAAFKGASERQKRLAGLSALLEDVVVESFTGEDAVVAADLAVIYERDRWKRPPHCLLGAGQALNRGWPLVTTNLFHFAGLGLSLIDWTQSDRVITPGAEGNRLLGAFEDSK
jgi:tRNA(fMet)-specific endonuclease VapC